MAHEPGAPLRVALLGCGVVGSAVATKLVEHADDLAARVGAPLELVGIAVRRPQRPRPDVPVDPALFTADAEELVTRADIVIEVIGGIEPGPQPDPARHGARRLRRLRQQGAARRGRPDALRRGRRARRRPLLRGRRRRRHPDPAPDPRVASPATTCAGCSASSTARPTSSSTRWTPPGAGFAETVEQAQALGYAEADPTADVEGFDAAAKAAILASLAFHTRVSSLDVHREGITEVTAGDIQAAAEMDCVVKLLAICERVTGADGGRRRQRARAPGDDPEEPPAGQRPRGVQRRLRRGGRGRRADVLRAGRRWRPHGIRRARRRRRRGPAQGRRWARAGGVGLRRPARRRHGPGPDEVPHQPRRGRPAGRARPGRDGLRRRTTCRSRRCASRPRPAGASGPSSSSSPTGPPMPRSRRPSTPSPTSTPSTTSPPSCAWKEPEPWRTSGAE